MYALVVVFMPRYRAFRRRQKYAQERDTHSIPTLVSSLSPRFYAKNTGSISLFPSKPDFDSLSIHPTLLWTSDDGS